MFEEILTAIIAWFQSTEEVLHWGLEEDFINFSIGGLKVNDVIFGFAGVVVLGLIEGLATVDQILTIIREKSTSALSHAFFPFFGFLLIGFGYYGIVETPSIAIAFDGLIGLIFYMPLAYCLWRFGSFSGWEKVTLFLSMAFPVVLILVPWKTEVLLLFCVGLYWALWTQLQEVRRDGRGVLKGYLVVAYVLNVAFWWWYGYITENPFLERGVPPAVFLVFGIAFFWFKAGKGTVIRRQ